MPPKKKNGAIAASGKEKAVEERYKKVTPIEHVLLRPEMYVGSKENVDETIWTARRVGARGIELQYGRVSVNHALLKIVDEILLNASDNVSASKGRMTYIRVHIDAQGRFIIENDGLGIPVKEHKGTGLLVPDMVFGHLLTSSNYGDDASSVTAGRHGYGAKLTNILSAEFSVECVCSGTKFTKMWTNNMRSPKTHSVCSAPASCGDYTKVSFLPDYAQFGVNGLSRDMRNLMLKRVLDLAVSCPSIKVTWNEIKLHDSFDEYVHAYLKSGSSGASTGGGNDDEDGEATLDQVAAKTAPPMAMKLLHPFTFVTRSGDLRFAIVPTWQNTRMNHTSVNGIVTYNGGSHANFYTALLNDAIDQAISKYEKANPTHKVKVKDLKAALSFIAILTLHLPKFDSQSKVRLVSKHDFPTVKTDAIVSYILSLPLAQFCTSTMAALQKELDTSSKKNRRMIDVPKLVEAPGIKGRRTLIVTEGDSAKSLALSSLSAEQKLEFSVFPLRGKVLNVRQDIRKLKTCKELQDLFQCMGLKLGEKVRDPSKLRHQQIMIMCDQDADGSHIKGLLINALHFLWPELCEHPNFITLFKTPLLKVFPAKGAPLSFYSRTEYDNYMSMKSAAIGKHTIKYYKGLGTSSTEEGKQYFRDISTHRVGVKCLAQDKAVLQNVFGADRADWRKQWLTEKSNSPLEPAKPVKGQIRLTEFVDSELVEFGLMDNCRMLPHVIDGLKSSQRKILWASLRRGESAASSRVSQLSGHVSEVAMFHHGEASLQQTIVRMAQTFTGSNNLNLLAPEGQFGSRLQGGSDHAAPRYIFTKLNKFARKLFPADDDRLLEYCVEEEVTVEPKFFVPVIPLLPANGAIGIGVGFMTNIQMYDPLDIISATELRLRGDARGADEFIAKKMRPTSQGFRGTTTPIETAEGMKNSWLVNGELTVYAPSTAASGGANTTMLVRVTEIPWFTTVEQYRAHLIKMVEGGEVLDFHDYSGENHIDIDVFISAQRLQKALHDAAATATHSDGNQLLMEYFGLARTRTNHVTFIAPDGKICEHGEDIAPIFHQHFPVRLDLYEKRRAMLINDLASKIDRQKNVLHFTKLLHDGKVVPMRHSTEEMASILKGHAVKPFDGGYGYLLNQSLHSFMRADAEALARKLESNEKTHKTLLATKATSMWETDLSALRNDVGAFQQSQAKTIAAEIGKRKINPRYVVQKLLVKR